MVKLRAIAVALFLVCVLYPSIASAHANLTSCSIRNNHVFSKGHTPRVVRATFAEEVTPNSKSWMAVFEGSGDHGLVNETTTSVVNFKNPKEMTLKLPALRPGRYYLLWYTVSAIDGHKAAGVVYFCVR
jgi:methionine-rich copper-binding protein CopC